jgi:hypothetical protein
MTKNQPSDMNGSTCACGAPEFIAKTGECRSCYNRRYMGERRRRALASPCSRCGRHPVAVRVRMLCTACATADKRANWSTAYSASHDRVRAARGPASRWRCIACGDRAEQWAYRSGSPREIAGTVRDGGKTKHMAWSPDPADYDPMCQPCHGRQDRANYGHGIRRDPDYQRRVARASYHRTMADPAKRAARNARQRAARARRGQQIGDGR